LLLVLASDVIIGSESEEGTHESILRLWELSAYPTESQSQSYSTTDRTENVSCIIAGYLITEKTFPQSCSQATAVVLSPVYKTVT
jgi:hypothetical protein